MVFGVTDATPSLGAKVTAPIFVTEPVVAPMMTSAAPAASPDGASIVMLVAVEEITLAQLPPTVTPTVPLAPKLVPVITISSPPPSDTEVGVNLVAVGRVVLATKVTVAGVAADPPPAAEIMFTSTEPALAPTGIIATTLVSLMRVTQGLLMPSIVTLGVPIVPKPVPERVISAPPAFETDDGEIEVMSGLPLYVYLAVIGNSPHSVVTVIGTDPTATPAGMYPSKISCSRGLLWSH